MADNHIDDLDQTPDLPGIIAELGELKPGAIIFERGLARLFERHPQSIKRAVQRGELPQPARLFGKPYWTVGVLTRHAEDQLQQAAEEASKEAERIRRIADEHL